MADKPDIAAMKLSAITGCGTKKDFIDFYFLLKYFTLAEMLTFYMQKIPMVPSSYFCVAYRTLPMLTKMSLR